MLRIYPVSLELVRDVQPLVRRLRSFDRNLADQLDRACTAVPLHLAEADGLRDGLRRVRHQTALGEARETASCLDVANAKGFDVPVMSRQRLDHVIGVLVKLTR